MISQVSYRSINLVSTDGSIAITELASGDTDLEVAGGGGGTPSAPDTSVQYNNAGAFGGSANFTYTSGTDTLTVGNLVSANFTSIAQGLVPASGGGTTNFLRADGTFAAPPSTPATAPAGSTTQIQYNNSGAFGATAGFSYDTSSSTYTFNIAPANIPQVSLEPVAPTGSQTSTSIRLRTRDASATNAGSGGISVSTGRGNGTGGSGSLTFTTGVSPSGTSGQISFTAGTGAVYGGNMRFDAGAGTSNGTGGLIQMSAGLAAGTGSGGGFELQGGNAPGTGFGGGFYMASGGATSGFSGDFQLLVGGGGAGSGSIYMGTDSNASCFTITEDGSANSQMGFFNATPVVKPAPTASGTQAVLSSVVTSLSNLGLVDATGLTNASTLTAAGANTEIQFNNAGAFGASSNFTYNTGTNTVSLGSITGSALAMTIQPLAPTSGSAGVLTIKSRNAAGSTGNGGDIVMTSGQSGAAVGSGGNFTMTSGVGISGNGGDFTMASGQGGTTGGAFYIAGGSGQSAGGNVDISSGGGDSGPSGDIAIYTSAGATANGSLSLQYYGMKINWVDDGFGTITNDIGFFGATPVAKPAPTASGTGDVLSGVVTALNNLGLIDSTGLTNASTLTAAGSNTQIQYNNSGAFGADANFTYTSGTNTLSVPTIESAPTNGSGSGTPLTLNGAAGTGGGFVGGNVAINAGAGTSAAGGGSIVITAGAGTSSAGGGDCTITAGSASGGAGGSFVLQGGSSASATGGDVTLAPGPGATLYGELNLADGVSNLITVFYDLSTTTSKLGFFGIAPAARPAPVTANPAEGLYAIGSALNDLGLIVGGGLSNIDATFTSTNKGFVPASGGGTTNFLRADGTFAAPSGGGSSPTTGTATIDFGGGSGSNEAQIAVTGQTGILTTSTVTLTVKNDSTSADHTANDHSYFLALASVNSNTPTAGVGFTIKSRSINKLTGTWTVSWSWL